MLAAPFVLLMLAAAAPPAPGGTLLLDIADPTIEAVVAGTTVRLSVDLDQKDAIELNPAVAARLALGPSRRFDASVGRVTVPGWISLAQVTIGGVTQTLPIASHDRPCCTTSDGAVGPLLLPFGTVRFVRAGALPGATTRTFDLAANEAGGAFIRDVTPEGRLMIQFSLRHRETLATASSAAILAKLHGGAFVGPTFQSVRAFGVPRPARAMAFATPAPLAGFAIDRATVRLADFRGGFALPNEKALPGDIAVSGRAPPSQHAWPAVIIGRDQLDRCSEIAVYRVPPRISLTCAQP